MWRPGSNILGVRARCVFGAAAQAQGNSERSNEEINPSFHIGKDSNFADMSTLLDEPRAGALLYADYQRVTK